MSDLPTNREECQHPLIGQVLNGDLVCRDCGQIFAIFEVKHRASAEPFITSAHDHGNCELCDELEQRASSDAETIQRLTIERDAAQRHAKFEVRTVDQQKKQIEEQAETIHALHAKLTREHELKEEYYLDGERYLNQIKELRETISQLQAYLRHLPTCASWGCRRPNCGTEDWVRHIREDTYYTHDFEPQECNCGLAQLQPWPFC